MATPTPLERYIRVQRSVDREMAAMLRDAADEAERMMLRLAKQKGIGAQVRRAQLGGILRELRKQQAALWGNVTKATELGMRRAAEAAAEAEIVLNRVLLEGAGVPYGDFEEAMRIQATESVMNVASKDKNHIPLSQQVYKSRALANDLVNKAINRGILLGFSAKELAASVKHLIDPNVKGGVSYAAMRLARSEINNAFHRTQIDLRQDDPWAEGMKWHLSKSHPHKDKCNDYAESVHFKGGEKGVFEAGNVPGKPHPNCLCYLTTELIGEEEFIDNMASGKYDKFMNDKTDEWGV
jgi:hypothetical protein